MNYLKEMTRLEKVYLEKQNELQIANAKVNELQLEILKLKAIYEYLADLEKQKKTK